MTSPIAGKKRKKGKKPDNAALLSSLRPSKCRKKKKKGGEKRAPKTSKGRKKKGIKGRHSSFFIFWTERMGKTGSKVRCLSLPRTKKGEK